MCEKTCFMGDCIWLSECVDYEAQSGKWGKCYEFEEKGAQ